MSAIIASRKRERSPAFISTWQTDKISTGSSSAKQISLPVYSGGIYDFEVNWGDGTSSNITNNNLSDAIHEYVTAGTYTITIEGTIYGFRFANLGDRLKLLSVLQWGCLRIGNRGNIFMGCTNLNIPNVTDTLNLKGVTNLTYLFCYCRALTSVNLINNWDVSNITTLKGTFHDTNFNQPLSNWDTGNVTDMLHLFSLNTVFNQDIRNWNTKNVTTMRLLFWNNYAFNQDISLWDTGKVTDMYQMFCNARSFNKPLNSWNTENVTDMMGMFTGTSVFNQPLNNWKTGNVTTMQSMFREATAFNQNIDSWNVSKVTDMQYMFNLTSAFNQPLNNWDTSNVTTMLQMFGRATAFNQPLNKWNTGKVTDMTNMFRLANGLIGSFNQDISSWDTGNVTTMFYMFAYNTVFNQPLNNWNVSKVTDITAMFRECKAFNQPLNKWNVTNVTAFTNFMLLRNFPDYSAENYNALLIGWSAQNVLQNRIIHFGTIKYSSAALNARNILTGTKNWTIHDGGITS